jgi:hypothetical protein
MKIIISLVLIMSVSFQANAQTSNTDSDVSVDNLNGTFVSNEGIELSFDLEGNYYWSESGGIWSAKLEQGQIGIVFEDNYGETLNAKIKFINRNLFTLVSDLYGEETYARKK